MHRNDAERVSLAQIHHPEFGLAQARRVREHGVKHGLQFAGRTRNDVQHLGGRGLPLQRFAQLIRALAQLVEQARILDGDDRLRREVCHQLNLLVAKGAHLLAIDEDGANKDAFLDHRDGENGASTGKLGERPAYLVPT